jgi:hypothetical protein
VSHDDFAFEPVRGLPRRLPPGERILWQGSPDASDFAFRFLKLAHLTGYFIALVAWVVVSTALDGASLLEVSSAAAVGAALALVALGLVRGYAELVARTTVYTMTDKRFVLRVGIALPISVNLPFSRIDAAAMRATPGGTGEIALKLRSGERIAYLVLWPHTRSWHMARPEPVLRCLHDVRAVSATLGRALGAPPAQGAATDLPSAAPRPVRTLTPSAA